jgi:nucleotide-binding universal stress UspA family protein
MSVKVIVSYDGTANEDDAIALGRLFGRAGAEVSLAYVRHAPEADANREQAVEAQAHGVLEGGSQLLGDSAAKLHVVTDRSTPEGLSRLAQAEHADVIVFCSDSHTAKGHVSIGKSAERLLEGGIAAVPAGARLVPAAPAMLGILVAAAREYEQQKGRPA